MTNRRAARRKVAGLDLEFPAVIEERERKRGSGECGCSFRPLFAVSSIPGGSGILAAMSRGSLIVFASKGATVIPVRRCRNSGHVLLPRTGGRRVLRPRFPLHGLELGVGESWSHPPKEEPFRGLLRLSLREIDGWSSVRSAIMPRARASRDARIQRGMCIERGSVCGLASCRAR